MSKTANLILLNHFFFCRLPKLVMSLPADKEVSGSIPDSAMGYFIVENYFTVCVVLVFQ